MLEKEEANFNTRMRLSVTFIDDIREWIGRHQSTHAPEEPSAGASGSIKVEHTNASRTSASSPHTTPPNMQASNSSSEFTPTCQW